MKYPLIFYFFRLLSIITPKVIQTRRLEKIEKNAKMIADKKNIPFLIRCKIFEDNNKEPDSFTSIGFSYQYEQMRDGKYNIYIYPQNGMASQQELLITIFHEYGHFIDYCTSVTTKQPLKQLHEKGEFPIYYDGTFEQDFAELFAFYILDFLPLKTEDEMKKQLHKIIHEGVNTLSNGNKKRQIDLNSL